MKFVIQRVNEAEVMVEDRVTGRCGKGFLIFIGVCDTDTKEIADRMIRKTVNLRIFSDAQGKTNLSIRDVGGSILAVSQFTLYADIRKGNRPSFTKAGSPAHAEELYEYILKELRETCQIPVEAGVFGAEMRVRLENSGPFTIIMESEELFPTGS
ncbi:MAG: D-tyrosyl-tRNA(Tyr) deacylase [Lachnospiraceae bacterium]|nr:D-tyrosyl-tRNA(Tyr) deacylase [Lachnospiraceae bacterium]